MKIILIILIDHPFKKIQKKCESNWVILNFRIARNFIV